MLSFLKSFICEFEYTFQIHYTSKRQKHRNKWNHDVFVPFLYFWKYSWIMLSIKRNALSLKWRPKTKGSLIVWDRRWVYPDATSALYSNASLELGKHLVLTFPDSRTLSIRVSVSCTCKFRSHKILWVWVWVSHVRVSLSLACTKRQAREAYHATRLNFYFTDSVSYIWKVPYIYFFLDSETLLVERRACDCVCESLTCVWVSVFHVLIFGLKRHIMMAGFVQLLIFNKLYVRIHFS